LTDKFDRADVVATVTEHPTERVLEGVDVGAAQATPVGDDPYELERVGCKNSIGYREAGC
jgi:hypothetical protein